MKTVNKKNKELKDLMNVGKATLGDLKLLGITTVEQLKKQNPDNLFAKLKKISIEYANPCVWDVLAAIIHESKTGKGQPWWHWSKIRKNKATTLKKRRP